MHLQALPPTTDQPDHKLDQVNPATAQVLPAPLAVSVDHAAKIMAIGSTLAWRLIKDSRLKTVKIYGRTVVPVAEIEAFLARNVE